MAYYPLPGTIAYRTIEHLKTHAPGTELAAAVLCEALDYDTGSFGPCVAAAREAGLLKARKEGRILMWSLGDGVPRARAHDFEPDRALPREAPPVRPGPVFPGLTTRPEEPATEQEPPEAESYPFSACRYIDGSLIVVGVKVRDDGAVIFSREQALQLVGLYGSAP